MTYDDFWLNNDPTLFWAYHTSFINRVKFEFECHNKMAWLSGIYNLRAFASVMSTEKDNIKYFEEPIEISPKNQGSNGKEEVKTISALELRMKQLVANTRKKIKNNNSGK